MKGSLAKLWKLFVLATVAALVMVSTTYQDSCNDVWVHALHGKIEISTKTYPKFSDYSFIENHDVPCNTDLVPSILFHYLLATWGYHGLLAFKFTAVVLIFIFLWLWMREEKIPHPLAIWVCTVFSIICNFHSAPRGDFANLPFLAMYLYLLTRYRQRQDRSIWILPLLQWLWIQFHYLACIGIFVILVYACESIPMSLCERWQKRRDVRYLTSYNAKLLLMSAICLLVSLVNEGTYRKVLLPFSVLWELNSPRREIYTSSEFLPVLFFTGSWEVAPLFMVLRVLISLGIIAILVWLNRKTITFPHLLLMLAMSIVTLRFRRMLGIYSIVIAGLILIYLWQLLRRTFADQHDSLLTRLGYTSVVITNSILVVLALSGLYFRWQNTYARCAFSPSPVLKPVRALEFMQHHGIYGNIYTDYNSGGFLGYHLYPRGKIFIHSLCWWYSMELLQFSRHIADASGKDSIDPHIWALRQNIDAFVLVHKDKPQDLNIVQRLTQEKWPLVYLDETTAIYLRQGSQLALDLKHLKVDLSKLSLENCSVLTPHGYYWLGNFLATSGYYQQAYIFYRRALQFRIGIPNIYNNLGFTALRLRNPREALHYFVIAAQIDPQDTFLLNIENILLHTPPEILDGKIYRDARKLYQKWNKR